jgi:hypothetical protein
VGLVKFLAHAAAQLSEHGKVCVCVDPAAQQFTPPGSQWHIVTANATNIALQFTGNETRDDGINISLQVTSSKSTHNLSISPEGGTCHCVHFEMAPSFCRPLKLLLN